MGVEDRQVRRSQRFPGSQSSRQGKILSREMLSQRIRQGNSQVRQLDGTLWPLTHRQGHPLIHVHIHIYHRYPEKIK